jgi:hypothetical protein
MYTIATLTQLRQHLGFAAADTGDDARLIGALQASAVLLERETARQFCPYRAVLAHPVNRRHTGYLLLRDDLLALNTVTDGDGSAIPLNDVDLLPYGDSPYTLLELKYGRRFVISDTPPQIDAIWGWHPRYGEAWRDSADTVQNNPLSASAITLTATNAAGADSAAQSPRLHVGHLLRIDSEYLRVLAINGNTLTVLRGVNGTTAASHTQNTPIYTFQPDPSAVAVALRYATWFYREIDTTAAPEGLAESLDTLRKLGV